MIENQHIEWKYKWNDNYLKWICAFANSGGGTLYIGIDDNGDVKGIKDGKKLLVEIPNKVRDFLGIVVEVKLLSKRGLDYIVIKVKGYSFPISYKGKFYLRSGSNTYEVTGIELNRLILERMGKSFDNILVPDFPINAISKKAIQAFKEMAVLKGILTHRQLDVSNEVLLRNLKLLSDEGISNAGILLFAESPEEWINSAYIKVGLFNDKYSISSNNEIYGPLILQVDRIMKLLYRKYFNKIKKRNNLSSFSSDIIPYKVMRELIINAIIHKSYDTLSPIQLRVYDDFISIWNPVETPRNLFNKNIYDLHASYLVNPNIAYVFSKCGLANLFGTGYELIKEECELSGMHIPRFKVKNVGVQVKCSYREDYLRLLKLDKREKNLVQK